MTIEQITLQRGYIWDYIHITWGDVKILNSSLPVQVRQQGVHGLIALIFVFP